MQVRSIADLVASHARRHAGRTALVAGDRRTTFDELDARANQVAQALASEGVGPGDRVAFLDRNSAEFFEVLFGVAKLGAVDVAVSWRLAPVEVAQVLDDAGASVCVVHCEFLPVLEAVAGQVPTLRSIVVIDGDDDRHRSYERWLDGRPSSDPGGASHAPEEVVLQLYTSGTTAVPKGVMLTNRNLTSLVAGAAELGLGADSVNLVPMPLFHIGGSGYALIGFSVACQTVIVREIEPAALLDTLVEQAVTNMFAVPAILQFMLAVPGVAERDFSALRTITYGASPISQDVLSRALATFGCRFVQVYGLTETTGTVTVLPADDHVVDGAHAHRLRSAGRAASNAEIRIVSPDGGTAGPREVGEVWIRSPQVTAGYWGKPDETAAAITPDGWLRTGDAGYLDEDGYLYIHDRVKDMIISGAENVYPAEVENALMSHPEVADVAVIGVPSERWGETVKAIVVPQPGARPTADALIAHARERLAHYKCPTSVDLAEALPRNAAGKVLKRELRAPYWAQRERAVG